MIINVRGGSGAGKSTVIQAIMDRYSDRVPNLVEGRKQPLWYDLHEKGLAPLRVLGHYEIPCGGCDTISSNLADPSEKAMDYIHRLIRQADDGGMNVLYEGVILTTILGQLPQLHAEGRDVVVINLTSDLETCLTGISERRFRKSKLTLLTVEQVRASLEEVTIKNNIGKLKSAIKTAKQLESLGVTVHHCDRITAVETIKGILRL